MAADFCVSDQTVRKWVRRWRAGGVSAAQDRSSGPRRRWSTAAEAVAAIERLRRQRTSSPVIARQLGLLISSVTKILRRLNRGPDELLHLDTKKLGRIQGIGHHITGRQPGVVNRHHGIGVPAFLHR